MIPGIMHGAWRLGMLLLSVQAAVCFFAPAALADDRVRNEGSGDERLEETERVEVRVDGSAEEPYRVSVLGLPAVSADGRRLAFARARSSYDESYRLELVIARSDGPNQRVFLDSVDSAEVDSPALSRSKRGRLLRKRAVRVSPAGPGSRRTDWRRRARRPDLPESARGQTRNRRTVALLLR